MWCILSNNKSTNENCRMIEAARENEEIKKNLRQMIKFMAVPYETFETN